MHITVEGRIVNYNADPKQDTIFYGQIRIDQETGVIVDVVRSRVWAPALRTRGFIFPGFIDTHAHIREFDRDVASPKEDFYSGSRAALNGGVTCIADMPNNKEGSESRATVTQERLEAKREAASKALVDVLLYQGITPDGMPIEGERLPQKAYLGAISTDGENPYSEELDFHTLEQLDAALERRREQDISLHLEHSEVLARCQGETTHEQRRPREAEVECIKPVLDMIRRYDIRAKFCHISTAETIELVREAVESGLDILVEVTPHHLFFDTSMITEENRYWLQMNPSLRSREDRQAMITAAKEETFVLIATDHAPHLPGEKTKGISGVPQLDTVGSFATWMMTEKFDFLKSDDRTFTPRDIARLFAYEPARFRNRFLEGEAPYGRIAPGYVASLTVLRVDTPVTIRNNAEEGRNMLETKCGWSPFAGVTFPGQVDATVVKGKIYERDLLWRTLKEIKRSSTSDMPNSLLPR